MAAGNTRSLFGFGRRLTVELASQAQQVKQSSDPNPLPKIQGQPAGQ